MVYLMIYADILPTKYLYGGIGAIAVISIVILPALFFARFKKSRKIICLILSIVMILER